MGKPGQQGSLLTDTDLKAAGQSRFENLQPTSWMGVDDLSNWKSRIARFQKQVILNPIAEQGMLFEAVNPSPQEGTADSIDPFSLPQQNTEFWRWHFDDVGVAALYFVIDYADELLLYVGETVKSNQRWKGEHDCKRYLMQYREIHYHYQLESKLGIAFWPHAPEDRRPRQQLETALIQRWKAPFNKENWSFWGTPFVGGK